MIELTKEESEKQNRRSNQIISAWDELQNMHEMASEFKSVTYLSLPVVYEITLRYMLDVRRIKEYHRIDIENINEFKIAGYLTYWIVKMKPVQYKESLKRFTRTQNTINEELAFHVSIGRINEERIHKQKPRIDPGKNRDGYSSFVSDLIYTLKYRVTTGDNLSQIYRLTEIL